VIGKSQATWNVSPLDFALFSARKSSSPDNTKTTRDPKMLHLKIGLFNLSEREGRLFTDGSEILIVKKGES
jgi:hypothetical protein